MYATCLFCHARLGANEAIGSFPVGRRLAFDSARGRLWVACTSCARWNLTPLEERWEAIEECERLYRGTKLRVSTDNVGLARLREGLELVRVGEPLRPELAAWRYGREFLRRRARHAVPSAALVVGGMGAASLMTVAAMPVVAAYGTLAAAVGAGVLLRDGLRRVRIHLGGTDIAHAGLRQLRRARIVHDAPGGWGVLVRHSNGADLLDGDVGRRALGVMLARLNREGGAADDVARSVAYLERAEHADGYLARLARQAGRAGLELGALPRDVALGLEMAMHEASERRAMEGELAALEREWRAAEEIAAIADGLALPPGVESALEAARARVQP